MAMKSKEWFYKQCLREVKQHGRFCHLCWNILEKGIVQAGQLPIFRNDDDHRGWLQRTNTILVDSQQIESGKGVRGDPKREGRQGRTTQDRILQAEALIGTRDFGCRRTPL